MWLTASQTVKVAVTSRAFHGPIACYKPFPTLILSVFFISPFIFIFLCGCFNTWDVPRVTLFVQTSPKIFFKWRGRWKCLSMNLHASHSYMSYIQIREANGQKEKTSCCMYKVLSTWIYFPKNRLFVCKVLEAKVRLIESF